MRQAEDSPACAGVTRVTVGQFVIFLRASLELGRTCLDWDQNDALTDAAGERQGMKKLAAAISVGAVALGTSVALCPPAAASPACPYDMSTAAGQKALVDATVAASSQVRSDEQALAKGDAALAAKDTQIERDSSNMVLACQGIAAPPQAQPQSVQQPVQQPDQGPFPLGDPQQASNNGACQNLNNFYSSLAPVHVGDSSFSALTIIPGVGLGEGIAQLGCAAGDIPNTLINPSNDNQSDMFSGACNGLVAISKYPVGEPCGNTPAG
jgi:hypothetical protein